MRIGQLIRSTTQTIAEETIKYIQNRRVEMDLESIFDVILRKHQKNNHLNSTDGSEILYKNFLQEDFVISSVSLVIICIGISIGIVGNILSSHYSVTMANAQLQVKFVTNRLGNQNLEHSWFKIQAKNKRGIKTYWKCSTSNCPATINTLNNIPTKISANHNHGSDPMQLKVDDVLQRMKVRCTNELTPIPIIYDEELVTFGTTT
ncbi:unnamed protein product [Mytilus edulis]|uniref:FLYWCH-type domain-containing protein n=1 Tax=Mytilus edulis TaxID=6550 RepID=A0A8S3TSV0_MYTED|nr:unnamed protein product [Mytilus edulis]